MKNRNIAKKVTAAVLALVMAMSITALSFAVTAANSKLREGAGISEAANDNNTINNALVRSLLSAHRKRES